MSGEYEGMIPPPDEIHQRVIDAFARGSRLPAVLKSGKGILIIAHRAALSQSDVQSVLADLVEDGIVCRIDRGEGVAPRWRLTDWGLGLASERVR